MEMWFFVLLRLFLMLLLLVFVVVVMVLIMAKYCDLERVWPVAIVVVVW